ncbi:MAG TPA: class I SAM-dependent methyltransferase [Egibacteraceae bacterium]|nr:class I SAM-dependent methyltransferase [Egibacteraceae bacterium]
MAATTGDTAARDRFVERLFGASIAALDLCHIYLGHRLGLYRTLAEGGPMTYPEVAAASGTSERYAREWLEHEAVADVLDVVEDSDDPGERRFWLAPAHAEVLLDADSLSYMPVALGVVGVARALPLVLDAFREGGGVAYEAYGEDVRDFISQINRPMFLNLLAQEWFPAVPGLVQRLQADPPATVVDVGCGTGWSTVAIARGFPNATVVGLDLDESSVAAARANAEQSGVADRVTFEVRDAADPALTHRFDVVCAFETIHDMVDPVGALRAMRALAAEDATVLVADERVADTFTTEVDDGERFQWGWSAVHCLPCALADPPAAGTGTIMRTPTFRRYAHDAGFADVTVLPIDNDFWRFYQLHP